MELGEKLSATYIEIEELLLEKLANNPCPTQYSEQGFRAATRIFFDAFMNKMWELQESERIPEDQRLEMVDKAGNELKNFIKKYTDIDTSKMYDKP